MGNDPSLAEVVTYLTWGMAIVEIVRLMENRYRPLFWNWQVPSDLHVESASDSDELDALLVCDPDYAVGIPMGLSCVRNCVLAQTGDQRRPQVEVFGALAAGTCLEMVVSASAGVVGAHLAVVRKISPGH